NISDPNLHLHHLLSPSLSVSILCLSRFLTFLCFQSRSLSLSTPTLSLSLSTPTSPLLSLSTAPLLSLSLSTQQSIADDRQSSGVESDRAVVSTAPSLGDSWNFRILLILMYSKRQKRLLMLFRKRR
ncbi:hypothetical protein CFOL_v3_31755, partial [Cephalotus follicularis]